MSNTVWFISFKLKKEVSVEDFLLASEKCHNEVLSQQKGFISWEVLRNGDTWVDLVKWETMEDAKSAETAGQSNPAAHEFYACLNMSSCKMQTFTVEKTH
jgi:heme-degrading monooxygenase HmoA